jgi:hypothetical protein
MLKGEIYRAPTHHTGEHATGINADKRRPIDPRMPNFPPA